MSDVGEPTSGLAKVRAGQGQGQSPQLLSLPYAGRCSEFLSEKGLPWLCPCWGARTGLFPEYGIHGSESDSWHLSGVGSQTPSFGVLNIGMLDIKYQVLGYQALGTMSGVLGMGGRGICANPLPCPQHWSLECVSSMPDTVGSLPPAPSKVSRWLVS